MIWNNFYLCLLNSIALLIVCFVYNKRSQTFFESELLAAVQLILLTQRSLTMSLFSFDRANLKFFEENCKILQNCEKLKMGFDTYLQEITNI